MSGSLLARRLGVAAALGIGLACLATPAEAQQGNCQATVRAELTRAEPAGDVVRQSFHVEVSSEESCAEIQLDLVLHEIEPNGNGNRVRIPLEETLHDGQLTMEVKHEMPASNRLDSYEAKIFSCSRCVLDQP